jgi:acyl-CoA thioester hydrolase
MTDNNKPHPNMIFGYRGLAQAWECDLMGHLNVSHYFGRSSDQAFFMRHALGLSPSYLVAENRGTVALQEHVRFHREVPAGGLMIGRSAPVEINQRTMTVCQEFRDSDDNLLTCFKTVIGFFDTAARKLLPWPEATLEKAENMLIDLPPHAAPKFLPASGKPDDTTRAQSQAEGFVQLGATAVNSWECDQFGHMNTMFYVRRLTEAVPHFWHHAGIDLKQTLSAQRGFAVGEMCVNYVGELLEGEMVETWTAMRQVNEKTAQFEHRLFNVETGALAAQVTAITVHFDLETRRATAWSDAIRAKLQAVTLGLDGD